MTDHQCCVPVIPFGPECISWKRCDNSSRFGDINVTKDVNLSLKPMADPNAGTMERDLVTEVGSKKAANISKHHRLN